MAIIMGIYPITPALMRQMPGKYYLWQMRKLLKRRGMLEYPKNKRLAKFRY
jgi:hypothetical protein